MRTALKYYVQRASDVDKEPGKQPPVVGKGFYFYVVKAKDETEHIQCLSSFEYFLTAHGVASHGFGDGAWASNKNLGTTKHFMWLDIPVHSTDEKERVEELYCLWKSVRYDGALAI